MSSAGNVGDAVDGNFCVTIRLFGTPVENALVTVDFTLAPDLLFCGEPAHAIDCPTRSVRAMSNAQGVACFTIGGGSRRGLLPSDRGTVRLYANGVLFSDPSSATGLIVYAFDLDGRTGLTGSDIALWLGDAGSSSYAQRSDFNGDGVLNGADIGRWLTVAGSGRSVESCSAYCP